MDWKSSLIRVTFPYSVLYCLPAKLYDFDGFYGLNIQDNSD